MQLNQTGLDECEMLLQRRLRGKSTHIIHFKVVRVLLIFSLFDVFNHSAVETVTVILILNQRLHQKP